MRKSTTGAALAAAFALSAGAAQAAGYAIKEQSATYQGAAFAGATARADDPATLFFNPAGITRLPGYQVSLSGTYIAPSVQQTSGSANRNPFLGGSAVSGGLADNAAQSAFVGSVYATGRIAPDWSLGLAVTAPYGLTTKYATTSLTRYQALTSYLRTTNVSPSIAWQATPTLSLGASLQLEFADAKLSNAVDFGAFLGLPGRADGIATLKGNDNAVTWQVGALWEPMPGTRFGAQYHAPAFHRLQGSVNFQSVPAVLAAAFPASTAAAAKLVTPDTASFGVAHEVGRWTLLADLSVTFWSRFNQLLAEYGTSRSFTAENWRDTGTLSLGADYRATDELTLRGGIAYDQSPVPNSTRTPRIPDADRYWISFGASYKPMPRMELSAAYTHIFVAKTKVALSDTGGASSSSFGRSNLTSAYSSSIDLFSVQATLRF